MNETENQDASQAQTMGVTYRMRLGRSRQRDQILDANYWPIATSQIETRNDVTRLVALANLAPVLARRLALLETAARRFALGHYTRANYVLKMAEGAKAALEAWEAVK